MAKILSVFGRARLARLVDPVGAAVLRLGVSPDAVTLVGTAGCLVGSAFVAAGWLLTGTIIITVSVCTDMVDGAMARARGTSSRFGAFLDSTMDRVADGAMFAALAFWLAREDRLVLAAAALVCLVGGQLVSYTKARAESLGFDCKIGIAERPERLLVAGAGAYPAAFGVPVALDIAVWALAVLSLVTFGQRLWYVHRQSRTADG